MADRPARRLLRLPGWRALGPRLLRRLRLQWALCRAAPAPLQAAACGPPIPPAAAASLPAAAPHLFHPPPLLAATAGRRPALLRPAVAAFPPPPPPQMLPLPDAAGNPAQRPPLPAARVARRAAGAAGRRGRRQWARAPAHRPARGPAALGPRACSGLCNRSSSAPLSAGCRQVHQRARTVAAFPHLGQDLGLDGISIYSRHPQPLQLSLLAHCARRLLKKVFGSSCAGLWASSQPSIG